MQVAHPEFRDKPNAYYSESSGAGLALLNHPKRISGKPMRVGVLGLGGGTLAAYGRSGDLYRFYEINPTVIQLAQHSPWFSYLGNSRAGIQIVEGDGRISLEDELKIGPVGYDVLVLDAFSGDQVPMHLLTKEAFDIYLQHLADGGVIAINISNRFLDLLPVLIQVKNHFNLNLAYIADRTLESTTIYPSDWVLISRDGGFMGQPAIARVDALRKRPIPTVRLWTDNYASLLGLIRP
jgi:spermidine synthase